MNKITMEKITELFDKFQEYLDTAEQHEFPKLFMIDQMIDATRMKLNNGEIDLAKDEDQKQMRAMFRVVGKTIGLDIKEYEEEETI